MKKSNLLFTVFTIFLLVTSCDDPRRPPLPTPSPPECGTATECLIILQTNNSNTCGSQPTSIYWKLKNDGKKKINTSVHRYKTLMKWDPPVGRTSVALGPPEFDRSFVFSINNGQTIDLGCMNSGVNTGKDDEWIKYTYSIGDACYHDEVGNCRIVSTPVPTPSEPLPPDCEDKCSDPNSEYCFTEFLCEYDTAHLSTQVLNLTNRLLQSNLQDTFQVEFKVFLPALDFFSNCNRETMFITKDKFINHGTTCYSGIQINHPKYNSLWFKLPEKLEGTITKSVNTVSFTFNNELQSPFFIFGDCEKPGVNCKKYSERVSAFHFTNKNVITIEGEISHCFQLILCRD